VPGVLGFVGGVHSAPIATMIFTFGRCERRRAAHNTLDSLPRFAASERKLRTTSWRTLW
jgi:hypothetical protein